MRQKTDMVGWEKKEMRLFIRGSYADASDRALFPVAVNKKPNSILNNLCQIKSKSISMNNQSINEIVVEYDGLGRIRTGGLRRVRAMS